MTTQALALSNPTFINTPEAKLLAPAPPAAITPQIPAFNLAWAAGFLDGEGCIHVAKQTFRCGRRPTHRLRVCIVQNHLPVLQHFQRGLGVQGSIHAVKRLVQHNRQVYTLNYDGRHAMAVIELLAPHLVRKRAEAIVAQQFCVQGQTSLRPGPKGLPAALRMIRERLYWKLRRMK